MTNEKREVEHPEYISMAGTVTSADEVQTRAWDGLPLAPGDYVFETLDIGKGQSSKGNPQFEVDLEVAEGPHKGKKTKAFYTMTEKAQGRWFAFLNAVGVQLDAKMGFVVASVKGRRFRATVQENTYEDGKNPMTGDPVFKKNTKVVGERALGQK